MNKYIEYDIHNGITYLKCGIYNILHALDMSDLDLFNFGPWISIHLVLKCMHENGWKLENGIYYSPTMRSFIFTDDINLTLELKRKNEC